MQPKYQALVSWIRGRIISGELHCGDKLQSEMELSAKFGISRQTVRQAIGVLAQEGLLESRQGSGTYVTQNNRPLRGQQRVVGIISTYVNDYIFPNIIRGMEEVLSRHGYTMQLAFTHNKVENERKALTNMLTKGVDGLIVEPAKSGLPNPNAALYRNLMQDHVPILFFNSYYPDVPLPHVALDDEGTGYVATQYLLRQGHRHIFGFFKLDDCQGRLRYTGYLRALMEAGVPLDDDRVLWYSTEDFDAGFATEDLLRRLGDSTALLCYNDQLALRMVRLLREAGRRVPADVSIVSVDNSSLASLCEVPLTSVAHPMERLGSAAAQKLLCLLENPHGNATVAFPARLVERSSVAPCTGR